MTAGSPPVWLLDIDGVINAATNRPVRGVWPPAQWRCLQVADGRGRVWPIRVAKPVVRFIRRVHEVGAAEIRWHTTWQQDAQFLATAVGLPQFPVQDCPEIVGHERPDTPTESPHRVGTRKPGKWFKLPAAERVLMHECRDLLWTDDDLRWKRQQLQAVRLMARVARVRLIDPTETVGLTPRHLRHIADYLGLDTKGRRPGDGAG